MLSIAALGAASGGRSTYYSDLAREDYYAEGGEPPGRWGGRGAGALGLAGNQISGDQLKALFEGHHPTTGHDLVQGAGENHRAGWDLTFSAPKSVSALFAVANPDLRNAIHLAHEKAVTAGLYLIEEQAGFTRRGHAGVEAEKLPGLIVAQFDHSTSREQDPELHTHALVLNVAQRMDGSWGSIESKSIYKWQHAAGAIYRAELAAQMLALGFQIEPDRFAFKISGVPDALCEAWSKRRAQIEAALADAGQTSAAASEIAALSSRRSKDDVSADRFDTWRNEAIEFGFTPEAIENSRGHAQTRVVTRDDATLLEALTAHKSTFSEQDLFKAVAIEAQHQGLGVNSIMTRLNELKSSKKLVRLIHPETGKASFTTQEMLQVEKSMVDTAKRCQTTLSHAISSKSVDAALDRFVTEKGFQLSSEQEIAVRHITSNTAGIACVRGAAGTGKSTMVEAGKIAWEAQGYVVRGAALSGKAAGGLEAGSGIQSQTIDSMLIAIESGQDQLTSKTVLVIDEAGMVGSKKMAALLNHVSAAKAKIVLIGDERQLQAIDAGGAFRALQNVVGVAELNEVRRQKIGVDRDAANAIARGEAGKALSMLLEYQEWTGQKRINIADDALSAREQLVEDWHSDKRNPIDKLVLAGKRAEVFELNQLARKRLKVEHRICNETQIQTATGNRSFGEGDRILFTKNDRFLGVKNGMLGELTRVTADHNGINFTVRLDDGEVIKFTPEDGQHIDHGYAITTHKSQGVTVDTAYVLMGSMSNRELSYVQLSRHRESAKLYITRPDIELELREANCEPSGNKLADLELLTKQMERSGQKETTLDYIEIAQESQALSLIEQKAEELEY